MYVACRLKEINQQMKVDKALKESIGLNYTRNYLQSKYETGINMIILKNGGK